MTIIRERKQLTGVSGVYGKSKRKLSFIREVRLVLLLILLLVVALNFISSLTFSKAKTTLENKLHRDLTVTADVVAEALLRQGDPGEIQRQLRRLKIITGMQEIAFVSSPRSRDISQESWSRVERGEGVLQKRGKGKDLTYLRPAYDKDRNFIGAVIVRAETKATATLNSLSFWDASIRMGGTVALLLVGFIFLRLIMSPFRRMLKDSLILNEGEHPYQTKMDEVEIIIETFSKTIRELKQREKTLQELCYDSERRADGFARYNEYILASISSGVIICSSSGLIIRFNPAAEKILGYQANSVLDHNFREVFGRESALARILAEALQEQKTYSRLELEVVTSSGETIQLGLTSSLIRDEKENVIGVFLLLLDISKIKELEKEMLFKQQMAALGEMSAGLAHELRNGMATITGYSKLLERNLAAPEKLPELVTNIIQESSGMELMLSHFLDFARQESLNFGAVDLRAVACESVVAVSGLIQEKKIRMKLVISPSLPAFEGDRLMLRQALQNLLLNSCQAVESGGRVGLFAYPVGGHRRSVKIVCLDNGLGVPEDLREKIFYPFFSTREKGTGLGLSLVKKVVLLHGGTIDLVSRPGSFTAFTIRLPVREVGVEQHLHPVLEESQ